MYAGSHSAHATVAVQLLGGVLQATAHSWIAGLLFAMLGECYEVQGSRATKLIALTPGMRYALLIVLLANSGVCVLCHPMCKPRISFPPLDAARQMCPTVGAQNGPCTHKWDCLGVATGVLVLALVKAASQRECLEPSVRKVLYMLTSNGVREGYLGVCVLRDAGSGPLCKSRCGHGVALEADGRDRPAGYMPVWCQVGAGLCAFIGHTPC